jgi:hypothetical protein
VTKFIVVTVIFLVTSKVAAKCKLLFNKLASGLIGQFVEPKLILSSSFGVIKLTNGGDMIFGHTLLMPLKLDLSP